MVTLQQGNLTGSARWRSGCASAGWSCWTAPSGTSAGRDDRSGRQPAAGGLAGAGRHAVLPGHPGGTGRRAEPAAPDHPGPHRDRAAGRGAGFGRLRRHRPAGRHGVGRRRADAGAQCPPNRADARHRGHHPGRAGPDHPGAGAGVLVVQGGPGTGKTVVALHRAAYLLYAHRDRLARTGCWWSGRTTASWTTSPRCCRASVRPGWCWPPPASSIPGWTPPDRGRRRRRDQG